MHMWLGYCRSIDNECDVAIYTHEGQKPSPLTPVCEDKISPKFVSY